MNPATTPEQGRPPRPFFDTAHVGQTARASDGVDTAGGPQSFDLTGWLSRLVVGGTLPDLPPFDVLAVVAKLRARYGIDRPRIFVSFSGGRSSALMAALVKYHLGPYCDVLFVFANTGREHPDTLRFVNDVDRYLDLMLVWVEAVVHPKGTGSTSRVVTYETASRSGEPFEAVVARYGIPNNGFLHCTRETKTNPMHHYVREVHGWARGTYTTLLGIRADEKRRVRDKAEAAHIAYPLDQWWPADKQDVLTFWEEVPWDLTIAEHWGNCIDCQKKSDRKLGLLAQEDLAGVFTFPIKLDRLYSKVGPNRVNGVPTDAPRKRYRGYMSTLEKLAAFEGVDIRSLTDDAGDGCTSSCELYETVVVGDDYVGDLA